MPAAAGGRSEHHSATPADDMAELRAVTRRLIADRPHLAHPVHDVPGVRR
ncbi:hypothetical protein [Streptomonospora alba]|nr:hypothetical protein [Streptomonospora alba]